MGNLSQLFYGGFAEVPWAVDKESFSLAASWTTNITWTSQKSRLGNLLVLEFRGILSGTSDTGNLSFTLPDSLSVDTSYWQYQQSILGWGSIRDNNTGAKYPIVWTYEGTGGTLIQAKMLTMTGSYETYTNVTNTAPITFTTSDVITGCIQVPIRYWDVSRKLSPRGSTFRGALVYESSADQTITTATDTQLTFDAEVYDTSGFHSTVTNTGRLTIPNGVSKVRLQAAVYCSNGVATGRRILNIYKNGSATGFVGTSRSEIAPNATIAFRLQTTSPILEVQEGDYFEANFYQDSGSSMNVTYSTSETWFSIEVIE